MFKKLSLRNGRTARLNVQTALNPNHRKHPLPTFSNTFRFQQSNFDIIAGLRWLDEDYFRKFSRFRISRYRSGVF